MGWLSDEGDDTDGKSTGERLGTILQLATSIGAVLIAVTGFEWVGSVLGRLGAAVPTVVVGPAVGLTSLGISAGVLALVGALAVVSWYRLPDSPE